MTIEQEILTWEGNHALLDNGQLLYRNHRNIPGSVQYDIRRYQANFPMAIQDTGMLVYHYQPSRPQEQYLELRYCISGNRYCP